MSNVLARKRSVSSLEFYRTARELRITITRLVMNEKHVPKKYRYVFAIPMVNLMNELFANITTANTFYPSSEHDIQVRRDFQTFAISNCEQILQYLQYMLDVLPLSPDKLRVSTELTMKEIALLKAWRKGNAKAAERAQTAQNSQGYN